MNPHIKTLATGISIAALIITMAVIVFSLLSGKTELYDIGVNLINAGVIIAALVIPLFYRSHHRARTRIHLHLPIEERNKAIPDPYYDYFAGIAFSPIVAVLLGFLLILLANSLGQRRVSNTTMLFVGSVRPGVIDMQEIALQHYRDAYLVELSYSFGQSKDYILRSEFATPANPYRRLVIDLAIDGKYVEESYEVPTSLDLPTPIRDEDWPIDSREAILIFAQDNDIKACINFPQSRKKLLELTRLYSTNDNDVKWCLRIEECTETHTTTCINAVTGEKITQ